MVLGSILAHGLTRSRLATLRDALGGSLSVRTLARWRTWWRDAFPQTPFWTQGRGRFAPPVEPGPLPGALLERFRGATLADRLQALLTFLAPLTVPGARSSGDG